MIKCLYEKHREIVAYLFWGVMATVVSWGSYSIYVLLLPESKYEVAISNTLSWITAVLFAFITNKIRVFRSKSFRPSVVFKELWRFIASRLVTGVIEIAGVPLLVKIGLDQKIFGIDGLLAKISVSVVVVILNYVFSKLFVFRHKEKKEQEEPETTE